jgi:hypothetical protein
VLLRGCCEDLWFGLSFSPMRRVAQGCQARGTLLRNPCGW